MPRRIRIAHEKTGRTDRIGNYAGGAFMVFVMPFLVPGNLPDGIRKLIDPTLIGTEQLTVVLHRFGPDGAHVETSLHRVGDARDPESRARAESTAATLIESLPNAQLGDIAMRPFEVNVEGLSFALRSSTGKWYWPDWELVPYQMWFGFGTPGFYDT